MACSKTIRDLAFTVKTTSQTVAFEPLSEWMPSTGITDMDFALKLMSLDGDAAIELMPALQLAAARSDDPDSPGAITGSYVSTVDTHHFADTLSAGSKFFVRFGVAYKLKSGESGLGIAQGRLSTALQQCGKVVGGKELDINPFMTDTSGSYFAITRWEPTVALDKIKAAFLVMDNANSGLEYLHQGSRRATKEQDGCPPVSAKASPSMTGRASGGSWLAWTVGLIVRTCNDPSEPNSWQTAETGWTNPSTGNTSRNTGELSVPAGANLSSNHLIQLGVAVRKTGANDPRATIRAVGALKTRDAAHARDRIDEATQKGLLRENVEEGS